jgi:glycosyltransferase involved in cell wall biosynthesis
MTGEELFSVIIPTLNEEEHIEKLITSIHTQDFRPIEITVVDDGSMDNTIEIVRELGNELNDSNFTVVLLETKNFGSVKGPAFARNIGIQNSHGSYILLVDADCLLTQKDILDELASSLKSHPVVGYKDIISVDNWLEYNQMLDEGNPPYATKAKWSHLALRREMLEKVTFDPQLGVGEDTDLLQKLRNLGPLDPIVIAATGHMHLTHTFDEYRLQRFWAGRTTWLFLRKYPNFGNILSTYARATPCAVLILAAVLSLSNIQIGMTFLALWIMILAYFFVLSPVKSFKRLAYLALRFTYGSFWYSFGLLKGFYDLYIKGIVNTSREK